MNWIKNNKKVAIAIGVVIVVLVLYWIFKPATPVPSTTVNVTPGGATVKTQ